MLNVQDIEIINDIIRDKLEVFQIKDLQYEKDYEYGNLPLDLPIELYELTDDPEFIDDRAGSFIEPIIGKELGYSITVSNFQGRYAIKKLDKSIFFEIVDYVDLDLIMDFSIVKTNIINEINSDLFQPLTNSLREITIYESFLLNVPDGLFRGLDLESLRIENSTFRNHAPDFGLNETIDIRDSFIFSRNNMENHNKLKFEQVLKKFSATRVNVDY